MLDKREKYIRERPHRSPKRDGHIVQIRDNRYIRLGNLGSRSVPRLRGELENVNSSELNQGSILKELLSATNTPQSRLESSKEMTLPLPESPAKPSEHKHLNLPPLSVENKLIGHKIRHLVLQKRAITKYPEVYQYEATSVKDEEPEEECIVLPAVKLFSTPKRITVSIPQPKFEA